MQLVVVAQEAGREELRVEAERHAHLFPVTIRAMTIQAMAISAIAIYVQACV